ncbi:MAG: hypothetical protein C0622_00655 [Desulfuromonas sp.]|nr:MAG: hypothetical protein C0622_00655 [Desulfuromonas sp.]
MNYDWKSEYNELAISFIKLHFGGFDGITRCFPCMRDSYPWAAHRPDVVDSRVPAKNNTEYHGLEKHAMQYHVTAQYEYAYHHWLMAAKLRKDDMETNEFEDNGHTNAVRYTIKQALYNKALFQWQQNPKGTLLPKPESYGLKSSDILQKEEISQEEIDNFCKNNNLTK